MAYQDVFLTHTSPSVLRSLDEHPELEAQIQSEIRKQVNIRELGFQRSPNLAISPLNDIDSQEIQEQHQKLISDAKKYAEEKAKLAAEKRQKRQEYLERAKRHWESTMKKITFRPPTDDYYRTCPLKPGFGFFKLLAQAIHSGKPLHVHIPTSVILAEDRFLLWTEETSVGPVVRVESDFRIADILKKFEVCKERACPAVVLRMPDGSESSLKAVPLQYYEFRDKLIRSQYPNHALVQLFLASQAERPAVTRLFYPARSRPLSSSLAFIITATDRGLQKPYGKHILLGETLDGFEAYPMSGQALNGYEAQAREIVRYLENAYRVRIDDIVLDFMPDTKGNIWLVGCKGLTVNAATEAVKSIRQKLTAGKDREELRELYAAELDDKLTSSHCKLCQMLYRPKELTQVLPYQTLLLFKRHCEKSGRMITNLSHLKACTTQALVHWVRLCDICYMLVRALHIPVEHDNLMVQKVVSQPSFMPAKLEQWRVLLYFKGLETHYRSLGNSDWKVEFDIFDRKNSLRLETTWESDTKATCHTSKLLYFFVSSSSEAFSLCKSQEVVFTLKRGLHSLAKGQCKPLTHFSCQSSTLPAVCEPFTLILFNEETVWGSIQLVVGLACDREMNVKALPISFSKYMNVYVPEEAYCNSEPLPEAWLEQFTREYKGVERTEVLSTSRLVEDMYTPRLQKREIFGREFHTHSTSPRLGLRPTPLLPLHPTVSPDPYSELMSLTRRVYIKGSPSVKGTPVPPSLSTSASARVLYTHTSQSQLHSPMFISSRQPSRLHTSTDLFPDTRAVTEGNESNLDSWRELAGSVERFLTLKRRL